MRGEKAFLLVLTANLIGMVYGYYYYHEQLLSSPLWLWPFIPDCPFYVMVFTAALLLTLLGFENRLLNYVGAVGMMKYGVWTLIALLLFSDYFFTNSFFFSSLLFILHIGMFAEGPLLINKKLSKADAGFVLAWFLVNDFFDYFYSYVNLAGEHVSGTHPILPSEGRVGVMMALTFLLTVVMTMLAYMLSQRDFEWPVRKEIESFVEEFQKMMKTRKGSRRRRR